jgi:hypothetical protein
LQQAPDQPFNILTQANVGPVPEPGVDCNGHAAH